MTTINDCDLLRVYAECKHNRQLPEFYKAAAQKTQTTTRYIKQRIAYLHAINKTNTTNEQVKI